MSEKEKPDIAFWFDDEGHFLVKIRQGIQTYNLVLAGFDLIEKALSANKNSTIAEWEQDE